MRGMMVALLGLVAAGCVRTSTLTYPKDWSPKSAVQKAECPVIAGRYANDGEIATGTQWACAVGKHGPYRGEWHCDAALSHNIAEAGANDWVELRQPDKDTLIMVSSDPKVAVKELHRSRGDFACSADGLERRLHASAVSLGDNSDHTSAGAAVFNAITTLGVAAEGLGSGGIRSLTRSFSPAADGSLVMKVSESTAGLVLLIPAYEKSETFVRWKRVEPPTADPSSAAVAAAGGRYGEVPAAHVGLLGSMNGFLHHVRVSNLDGEAVNTDIWRDAQPLALAPGSHWVQIDQIDHHLVPLRDFNTVYGFAMQADAGHSYRLDKRPPACLARGDIDAALAAPRVYQARVSVIDEAGGRAARRVEVDALCVSGRTRACTAADETSGEPHPGVTCVRLNGSNRGFYGSDAGRVESR